MRFRNKAAALALAVMAVLGTTEALTATPALANGTGNQWCTDEGFCPNAWSGGPYVKTYQAGAVNNDFTWQRNPNECNGGYSTSTCPGAPIPAGQPIGSLKFTGSGAWVGRCIGGSTNDPNDPSASLDACPSGSNNGGYGVNMVYLGGSANTCSGGFHAVFWDLHWRGYINPNSVNGSPIYLNISVGGCLRVLSPA